MTNPARILIVEDDMIIAANISLQLSNLGYEITGIETRGEDAVNHALENHPDVILMDIQLKGKIDGVETAKTIQKTLDIPIVYLTANSDDASFERAKGTRPHAFISKPFSKMNLERTIALVVEKIDKDTTLDTEQNHIIEGLSDRIFIRSNGKLVKVMLDEILYLEADRNYCHIYTKEQDYLVVNTLNLICEKLTSRSFLRVHRSFVVNLRKLDAVADTFLEINNKVIPIGKNYREDLMKSIQKV